ncbi:MAG: glycosyltransferase [Chloroflexota bacterium]|nr:glycosyltransferase [Chloroflexota bacterium]
MIKSMDDYRPVVGDETVGDIYRKARGLQGMRIQHINSTFQGGGVAEILNSLVPLMNDIGIDADWRVLHGTPDFFTVTKKFHNALQGGSLNLSDLKKQLYLQTNATFCACSHLEADCVIVHDPQPLPLIRFHKKKVPWIWRCHIDLSNPHEELWEFLKTFILRYDVDIISSEVYRKNDLPVQQRIISPAIDPLSLKNKELSQKDVAKYMRKYKIPTDKPLITQVSRMDVWKDPEGLLEVFKRVRENVDCRLVYCYDSASDDPEGAAVYKRTYHKARKLVESGDVIFVVGSSQILVNAIQRASTVIVQKSTKEGFCLAVTEALWKGKPVVGTNVGGIPLQITDGENGFLVDPYDKETFADRIVRLLRNPRMAEQMGMIGKETVRNNFLITRLLRDYLVLLNDVLLKRKSDLFYTMPNTALHQLANVPDILSTGMKASNVEVARKVPPLALESRE